MRTKPGGFIQELQAHIRRGHAAQAALDNKMFHVEQSEALRSDAPRSTLHGPPIAALLESFEAEYFQAKAQLISSQGLPTERAVVLHGIALNGLLKARTRFDLI